MGDIAGVRPVSLIKSVHLSSRMVSAVLLLAGLTLCLGSALGLTGALCLTEGCKLYKGYSFLGLSLHVWGAAAFGTGLILLMFRVSNRSAYCRFLRFCLWAEILLLAVQVIYLPCSECLLVGLIWGLLGLVEFWDRLTFKVWSGVFLVALVLMGKDLLHPWPLYGSADAGVKIYFSPSCPGCKIEIGKLLAGGEVDHGRVAFFPVALKSGDYERVEAFKNVLRHTLNVDQAFQAAWMDTAHAPAGWGEWLTVRLGLLRNRMVLARMGVNKIPLVVSGSASVVTGAHAAETGECGFDSGDSCAGGVAAGSKEKLQHDFLRSLRHDQPDSVQGIWRDGFKIRDRVSRGLQATSAVKLDRVEADQVERSDLDMQDFLSNYQQEPEPETVSQANEGDDQGGEAAG